MTMSQQQSETFGHVMGEVVWLMMQSDYHRHIFLGELEHLVMRPILQQHFRIYRDDIQAKAVLFWAKVSPEVEQRLVQGNVRLKPEEWDCGERYWLVDIVAPFGQAQALIGDLQRQLVPDGSLFYLKRSATGEREVVEVSTDRTADDRGDHTTH